MRRIATTIGILGLALLAGSCGPAYTGGRGTRGIGVSRSCQAGFGAGAAAKKLGAFIGAAATFTEEANELGLTVTATCLDMGHTLGLADAEMRPATSEVLPVEAACGAVAAKLRSEVTDLRASARLEVAVEATPPVCEVRIDAYAQCIAECEVEYQPAEIDIECRGGEIRGGCSGECRGRCAVDARASCDAYCEGTCTGACDGSCSVLGPDGQCAGTCDGTCQGRCEGRCVADVRGGCEGECRGECSVEWERPRCTGTLQPPQASAECKAACEARVDAQAECRPGSLYVDVRGEVASDYDERVARLRQAVQAGLPTLRTAGAKFDRMRAAGRDMVDAGRALPEAVATIGASAFACATQAVAAVADASITVTASIEVSASVSASVGG